MNGDAGIRRHLDLIVHLGIGVAGRLQYVRSNLHTVASLAAVNLNFVGVEPGPDQYLLCWRRLHGDGSKLVGDVDARPRRNRELELLGSLCRSGGHYHKESGGEY